LICLSTIVLLIVPMLYTCYNMTFFDRLIEFNKNHRVLSHVVFWVIMLLIQLSSSSYENSDVVPFKNNLMGDGINVIAQTVAAYILAYFIVPKYFYKQKYAVSIIYFIILSYVVCVLSRIEVIHFEEPF